MEAQPVTADRQSIVALPPPLDLGLLVVAIGAMSMSAPLIAATAAPALAIAFWRNAMGSAAILPWALLRRWPELRRLDRRTVAWCVLAGLLLAGHFATWVPSLTMTSVATSVALVAMQPVWAALYARYTGHAVQRAVWLGISLSVVGVAVLSGLDLRLSAEAIAGDGLALAGGALAAAYVTVGSRVRATVSATSYTGICYATCAIALLIVCLIGRVSLAGYSGETWLKLALLTAAAQLLGHSLVNVVLRSASATFVSLAILLEVPGAVVIAAIWLHQVPSAAAFIGLATVLAGTAVVVLTGTRAARWQLPAAGSKVD